LELIIIVINVVVFSICLPLALVSLFRFLKFEILVFLNTNFEYCKSHKYLWFNPLNALFVPSALNEKGLKARRSVFVNLSWFLLYSSIPMVLFEITGQQT